MTVRTSAKITRVLVGVALALAVAVPTASAESQQTVLYELTENAQYYDIAGNPTIDPTQVFRRVAAAELQGNAALGTALCPIEALVTNPKAHTCTVTATGTDDVTVKLSTTGQVVGFAGTVGGTYAVVVQGDNPVDGPELVVQTGTFSGSIDLSPTLAGIPLGTITGGVFTIDGYPGFSLPFRGTFRLPFAKDASGHTIKPRHGKDAFYLGDDGEPFPVGKNERALGWPTVRFEVDWQ